MDYGLMRLPGVKNSTGLGRSAIYERIGDGLMPPGVNLGGRAVAWPANEIEAVNRARIGGASNDQIRALVVRMVAERANLLKAA